MLNIKWDYSKRLILAVSLFILLFISGCSTNENQFSNEISSTKDTLKEIKSEPQQEISKQFQKEEQIQSDSVDKITEDVNSQEQKIMEQLYNQTEKLNKLMQECNEPFKCSSNCANYLSSGQKDCPSGQVCCLTEKGEVEEQEATEALIDTSEQKVYSSLEEVYTAKNPIGHKVRLYGIGLKLHAVSSEDFFLFTDDERVMNNPNYIAYYGAEYDIVIYNNPKIYVQQKIINITGTVVNCERKEDGKYCMNAESIEIVDEFVNA